MPTYEYLCDKCEHEFEREQRISDAPVKTCPECRSRKVKKLISRTSFVLKGGGWYSDLYSSSKDKPDSSTDADAGASSPASSGEGSGSDGDAKSAGKSDKPGKADKSDKPSKSGKASKATGKKSAA